MEKGLDQQGLCYVASHANADPAILSKVIEKANKNQRIYKYVYENKNADIALREQLERRGYKHIACDVSLKSGQTR